MKKIFLKLNMAIIFLVVLFANVSFAETTEIEIDFTDTSVRREDGVVFTVPKAGRYSYNVYYVTDDEELVPIEGASIYKKDDTLVNMGVYDENNEAHWDELDLDADSYVMKFASTYTSYKIIIQLDYKSEANGTAQDEADYNGIAIDDDEDVEWYEKIISWFIRLLGKGIQALTSLIAGEELSIDKLVFDQYSRTNLFIFKADANKYGENQLVSGALDSLNQVYSLFSKIAVTVYLMMLVYMGIRILTLSTDAGKRAKYKELLFDWVKGLIILYFFPYVMRYTILLNHAFVTYLYEQTSGIGIQSDLQGASIKPSTGNMGDIIVENKTIIDDDSGLDDENSGTEYVEGMSGGDGYMFQMYKTAEESKRITDAVIWVIMLIQVLQFLIVYLKRLITVVFLVAIFPLVAISYAIDKIGDGKSQAFNNWTKEFIMQVFIQSFHAVNYVLIMGIIISLPNQNWFLKVIGITYVAKGGEILRKLFAQMKGGTGQGPLDVAKAMIKTNVAISGLKSIRSVASRTFGRNSVLGHGVGMLSAARDTAIERRMVRSHIKAAEAYSGKDIEFYGDGTAKKKGSINIDEITEKTNSLLAKGDSLTDVERKQLNRNLEDLSGLSEEDLRRALSGINLDDKDKKLFEDAIFVAAAHRALNNRKGKTKAEIRSEVDIELKYRSDPSLNKYATMYLGHSSEREINNLKKKRIANSVEFIKRPNKQSIVPEKATDRRQQISDVRRAMRGIRSEERSDEEKNNYWRIILDSKGDEELERVIEYEAKHNATDSYSKDDFEEDRRSRRFRLTREAVDAFKSAYKGSGAYTRDELYFYSKVIDDAQDSDTLKRFIEQREEDELKFSIDDFRKTMDVEVINHSHDDGADFERTNEAIRHLKNAITDKNEDKEILNNLRANLDDLEEGVLPELREVRDEVLAMQEKAKREMASLSDVEMLGRMTPEHLQYLRDRETELTGKFRRQLARGAATTVAGAAVGQFKFGTEVAVAGVATGATASGKNGNMLEDIITVVPNAVKATEATLHSAGSIPSRIGNATADTIIGDQNDVDLKIIDQSMKINDKYYRNKAALDKVDGDISDAKRERDRLLDEIKERVNKK